IRLVKGNFDFLASRLVEDLSEGRIVGQVERKALESFADGIVAVVANHADLAAVRVLQDQALEQIVEIGSRKGEIDLCISLHHSLALKVTDAAAEENDLRDRETGPRLALRVHGRG